MWICWRGVREKTKGAGGRKEGQEPGVGPEAPGVHRSGSYQVNSQPNELWQDCCDECNQGGPSIKILQAQNRSILVPEVAG